MVLSCLVKNRVTFEAISGFRLIYSESALFYTSVTSIRISGCDRKLAGSGSRSWTEISEDD